MPRRPADQAQPLLGTPRQPKHPRDRDELLKRPLKPPKPLATNTTHHQLIRGYDPRIQTLHRPTVDILTATHMHMRARLLAADLTR